MLNNKFASKKDIVDNFYGESVYTRSILEEEYLRDVR